MRENSCFAKLKLKLRQILHATLHKHKGNAFSFIWGVKRDKCILRIVYIFVDILLRDANASAK